MAQNPNILTSLSQKKNALKLKSATELIRKQKLLSTWVYTLDKPKNASRQKIQNQSIGC